VTARRRANPPSRGVPETLRLARAAILPDEHDEQATFFRRLALLPDHRRPFAFAIPNGGYRHAATARALKAEGVIAGVPDVFVARPVGRWGGLWIELKRRTGGKVSPAQDAALRALAAAGYAVTVAAGHEEAWAFLEHYLAGGWNDADQRFRQRTTRERIP